MTKEKSTPNRKGNLYRSLQAMSIVPVLVLGLIILVFGSETFTAAMHKEVERGLKNAVEMTALTYDLLYPGDYCLTGDIAYNLLKGDTVINGNYEIVDSIREKTGMEITLFYYDTRILTTIRDSEGERIVGTSAENRVLLQVLGSGKAHFYTNASINGQRYFAYYSPLYNSKGEIIGMLFAGTPCAEVDTSVRRALTPLLLITLFSAALVGYVTTSHTNKLIRALQQIRSFLFHVSTGDLSAQIDLSLLNRHDELSEMARSAIYMQNSLRTLIEEDALTGLNNRRFGDQKLRQFQTRTQQNHSSFTIALGDIDFFKKVNDTYGHENGDVVLKEVAAVLKRNMTGKGFAVRWGGEEFLLVFDSSRFSASMKILQKIMEDIRAIRVPYGDQIITVTMTFGILQSQPDMDIKDLLHEVDEKLYAGKEAGRNRIVT